MQRQASTWRQRWTDFEEGGGAYATALVLLVIACLTLGSWLVWRIVPPRWTSPGYSSFVGYGKNVEHAALALSGLVAVALCLGLPRRLVRLDWTCALLIPTLIIAYRYASVDTQWLPPVLIVGNIAYFVWYYRRDTATTPAPALAEPWPKLVTAGLFALVWLYVCQQGLWPKVPAMFDQGQAILSAHDWLAGGKPYETMFWPHGLHDTGTTALFTWLTGNRGLGADTLAKTTINLLGLISVLLICRNVLRRWADATLAAGLVAVCFPPILFWLGNAFFVVLAWQLLARRHDGLATFAAGGLLALGFLWRFDCGAFGLLAAAAWLIGVPFYRAYSASSDRNWRVLVDRACHAAAAKNFALLVLGVWICWLFTWSNLGVPNATLFAMQLRELPRYYADNAGFPLLLPLHAFEQFPEGTHRLARWVTVQTLLFAAAVLVFLLVKIREKRLAVATPEDRFCLMLSLFCLLSIKSLADRCDIGHALPVFAVWCLLYLFDFVARYTWQWPALFRLGVVTVVTVVCVGGGFFQMQMLGGRKSVLLREGLAQVWLHRPQVQVRQALGVLAQCVSPTRRWEDLLEPTAFEDKPQFLEEVRQLRHVLDQHQVGPRGLLATHSGPLVYPLVDRRSPTRYYLLGAAMTESMQRDAIADLETSQVQAVLRLSGYGVTMPYYDVPDEHRIPLIHKYVSLRAAEWPSYVTRFGVLYVNAESSSHYLRLTHDAAGEALQSADRSIRITTEPLGFLDQQEVLDEHVAYHGWSGDPQRGLPAEQLLVFLDGQCVFAGCPHAPRPDVVQALSKPELLSSGFDFRLSRRLVPAGSEHRVRLFAVLGDRATELTRPAAVVQAPTNQPRG